MTPTPTPGPFLTRKPGRLSVTLPAHTLERLQCRATEEGRSTSNLAAFLIERGLAR